MQSANQQDNFLRLYMKNQRAIFGYLLSGLNDFQKAEDLLQEVALVLWKKFDGYQET